MIITKLSLGALIPTLRKVITAQISSLQISSEAAAGVARDCLQRISISRVFDIEGLWEVLRELDSHPASSSEAQAPTQPDVPPPGQGSPETSTDDARKESGMRDEKTEILDSEDEGGFSSPESSPETRNPPETGHAEQSTTQRLDQEEQKSGANGAVVAHDHATPDIILITHMSSLLTALFTHRERDAAHSMLQLLSSHLHYVTRSPEHREPLVMVLNSTTSSPSASDNTANRDDPPDEAFPLRGRQPAEDGFGTARRGGNRPLDPTLRSIFNPPPLPVSGLAYGYRDTSLARRNKPSFGLVFSQLLDLHLLCTRVPRSRPDAEALYAPAGAQSATPPRYAWVVEVLLDEIGVWEEGQGAKARRSRGQRWGAVDVVDGAMIVDAFAPRERKVVSEIRVAGGFGGLRV